MKRHDKTELRDYIKRIKGMKWPKIKPVNRPEQKFISTVLDAVNILEIEILSGNVPAELPPGSFAHLPTAIEIEDNLKIIKENLYPLIDLLRHLEPKKHKAATKHMRHLLEAVGYSYWINPGSDLVLKERNKNWQGAHVLKESEAHEALAAIVINVAGNKKPLYFYDWIETKLKTINNKLIAMGHSPLVENFDDEKYVEDASDKVYRILANVVFDREAL